MPCRTMIRLPVWIGLLFCFWESTATVQAYQGYSVPQLQAEDDYQTIWGNHTIDYYSKPNMDAVFRETFEDLLTHNISDVSVCSYIFKSTKLELVANLDIFQQGMYKFCAMAELVDRHMHRAIGSEPGTFTQMGKLSNFLQVRLAGFSKRLGDFHNSTAIQNIIRRDAQRTERGGSWLNPDTIDDLLDALPAARNASLANSTADAGAANFTYVELLNQIGRASNVSAASGVRVVLHGIGQGVDFLYNWLELDRRAQEKKDTERAPDTILPRLFNAYEGIQEMYGRYQDTMAQRNWTHPHRPKLFFSDENNKPRLVGLRHHPIRGMIPEGTAGKRFGQLANNLQAYAFGSYEKGGLLTSKDFKHYRKHRRLPDPAPLALGDGAPIPKPKKNWLQLLPVLDRPEEVFPLFSVGDTIVEWIRCWRDRERFCIDSCSCYALPKLDPQLHFKDLEWSYVAEVKKFFDVRVPMDYCKHYEELGTYALVDGKTNTEKAIGRIQNSFLSIMHGVQMANYLFELDDKWDDALAFFNIPAEWQQLFHLGKNIPPERQPNIHMPSEMACFAKYIWPSLSVVLFIIFIPAIIAMAFSCVIPCLIRDLLYEITELLFCIHALSVLLGIQKPKEPKHSLDAAFAGDKDKKPKDGAPSGARPVPRINPAVRMIPSPVRNVAWRGYKNIQNLAYAGMAVPVWICNRLEMFMDQDMLFVPAALYPVSSTERK